MANIGPIACTFVKPARGEPEANKPNVVSWQRPGMVGEGNQITGAGPGIYQYLAVYYGPPGDVLAWGRALEQLVGTVVSITDDFDSVYPSMLIKRVGPIQRMVALDGTAVLRHRGQMQVRGTIV